ncbi:hypothetical protein [Spirosoma areae]
MSENEIIAHDKHYQSDSITVDHPVMPFDSALHTALDAAGYLALNSEMRDFTLALWQLGYAIAPMDRHFVVHSGT